jgi:hypothetical protein
VTVALLAARAGSAALVVSLFTGCGLSGQLPQVPALVSDGGVVITCEPALDGVIETSLDFVKLTSPSATADVSSVELIGVTGSLRLAYAVFIPTGGTGYGAPWSSLASQVPAVWKLRRDVPGRLSFVPEVAGLVASHQVPPVDTGAEFQLVVGVVAGASGGGADHTRVHYRSGGQEFAYDGQDRFMFSPKGVACR